jgi:hypothetical protein
MKTKLLKKLRKQFAWKCVRRDAGGFMVDEWALLYIDQSIITFHSSSERVLYSMLNVKAPEYSEFSYWNRLLRIHFDKMMRREFNRIGNASTRRQAPPLPPRDRKGQKI